MLKLHAPTVLALTAVLCACPPQGSTTDTSSGGELTTGPTTGTTGPATDATGPTTTSDVSSTGEPDPTGTTTDAIDTTTGGPDTTTGGPMTGESETFEESESLDESDSRGDSDTANECDSTCGTSIECELPEVSASRGAEPCMRGFHCVDASACGCDVTYCAMSCDPEDPQACQLTEICDVRSGECVPR